MPLPDPKRLSSDAEDAPLMLSKLELVERYGDTVRTLRAKGYSHRKIVEWLQARGVPINDHKVVHDYCQREGIE